MKMKRWLERRKERDAAALTANPEAAIAKFAAEADAARVLADRAAARSAPRARRRHPCLGAAASSEVAGSRGASKGDASGSRTSGRDNSDLREGRSLPRVITGKGVELAARQSTIASGTPKSLRGAPLASRVERPLAQRVQPALPR
ncbi:hypothetical protein VN97_g9975 [Penicillium thymicola]|uniref:Uncharacterized protein n=1 Tax=Penicillium thymicola TaxID=293382 RepID=A0AAI9X477_PENTH|nr:hypothetical protein VN97_g9975 [Penicillium thymicola]